MTSIKKAIHYLKKDKTNPWLELSNPIFNSMEPTLTNGNTGNKQNEQEKPICSSSYAQPLWPKTVDEVKVTRPQYNRVMEKLRFAHPLMDLLRNQNSSMREKHLAMIELRDQNHEMN